MADGVVVYFDGWCFLFRCLLARLQKKMAWIRAHSHISKYEKKVDEVCVYMLNGGAI